VLSQTLQDQLKKIVGKDNLQIHSEKVFVTPENTSVVSEIVRLASQKKLRILPLGSGSILEWSKHSSENMIVLKSSRLNMIKKVVPEDLYVILQAGFPLKDLNQHLESFNLFYPLADNSSSGTIGGAVASNLKCKSGEKNIQTREFTLALQVIDPDGQILNMGARTFKSVTGYDLPRLIVGSWGSLGFISEISLRLMPLRKRKDYPGITFEPPKRIKIKGENHLKAILSSRIKKSLDPNGVFVNFDSV
jgi:FAD/FMN-containing dehydrogenase